MTTEINVTESAAAEILGLGVGEVKRLRKEALVEGRDFEVVGRSVRITTEGMESLSAAVLGEKKEGVPVAVPRVMETRDVVVDALCPNPRILLCHYVANGAIVRARCRVRNSKNFTRGMTVEGCRVINDSLVAYEGRLPRLRGRFV
jgi:hypothetical protein